MNEFDKAMEVMDTLFGKDYTMVLATTIDDIPSIRFIDTYYKDGAFYIVTYAGSRKVYELMKNPNVALTNRLYKFSGKAYNIGHPLLEENKEIREVLIKEFEPWYFAHNNEEDKGMCYVKVELEEGFFYNDGVGYQVNFKNKEVHLSTFAFDIEPVC